MTTYQSYEIVENVNRPGFAVYDGAKWWFDAASEADAKLKIAALFNQFTRKDNESLAGVLSRAIRNTRVGQSVFVSHNNLPESAWVRIRQQADGTCWMRL